MISETKQKLSEIIKSFKDEFAKAIDNARISNPNIRVLNTSPGIFTMKASALSSASWDPEYYDYNAQFDILLDKLNKQSIDAFSNTLDKLVETGKVDGTRFHPDVIKKIQEIR